MNPSETLEEHQVARSFVAILAAVAASLAVPTPGLAVAIEPALVAVLFATFLHVPLADIGHALLPVRFLVALPIVDFVAVPLDGWKADA